MALCASCGLELSYAVDLCPHHLCVHGDDWAAENRVLCDFIHRGIVPPRLPAAEREPATFEYA